MRVPSILTLCVNYHNEAETVGFVRGLLRQEGDFNQTVAVVDNSVPFRADSPLRSIRESDERVCVLWPDRNLGYFGGAAWGLCKYTDQFELPDWIIVSNSDIEMSQPDFLSNLIGFHSSAPPAVIAPAIFSELSRRDLNPYMENRPTRLRMRSYKLLFRYYLISSSYHALSFAKAMLRRKSGNLRSIISGKIRPRPSFSNKVLLPRPIYAPQGSFVVFGRKYFECGGSLDHGAFLCGEEFFIAETARRLGLAVLYDPRLEVVHKEHATLSRYTSRQLLAFQRDACGYVTDTFFSESTLPS